MLTTLLIVALIALASVALHVARTPGLLYWGRRSQDFPFTPLQQKLIGYVWSISLLTFAARVIVGALFPGKIDSATSDALTTIILASATMFTIAVALLDGRFISKAKSSLFGRFAIVFMWTLVAIWTAIIVHEFWGGWPGR
jgi:hypothetical protein